MSLLLEMTLSGALLIVVIAIIRALIMHKLPKRAFIVLWCIALFQLIIPFSIPSQASIFNFFGTNGSIQQNAPELSATPDATAFVIPNFQVHERFSEAGIVAPSTTEPAMIPTGNSRLPAIEPLALIYFAGLAISAIFFTVLYRSYRKEFRTSLPVSNEFIVNWLAKHRLKRQISIRVSDRITTPLTYGIFRPVILLPKDTNWKNASELNYVLAHEFVHIKRFDALTKLIMAATLCVHWFNPFVWGMYLLFNRDVEISCDEAVIHMLGETSKQGYALTLISMVERKSHLPALYNNFSKYAIEERITAIMKMKKRTIIGTIAALLIVGITATVFATSRANETTPYSQPPVDTIFTAVQPPYDAVYAPSDTEPAYTFTAESQEDTSVQNQFLWPLSNEWTRISSGFGFITNPASGREEFHTGIDIPAPEGTPILAAKDGYVTFAGHNEGFGNMVIIYHGEVYSTVYAQALAIHVETRQFVRQGEHIADVGSTGASTGPHLHFEIRINDIVVDPLVFLGGNSEGRDTAMDEWAERARNASHIEAAPPALSEFPIYVIEHPQRNIRFALAHAFYENFPAGPYLLPFEVIANIAADAIYQEFGICIDGMDGHMLFVDNPHATFANNPYAGTMFWSGFVRCEELTTHSWGYELFHFVIDAVTGGVISLYMNTPETPFRG